MRNHVLQHLLRHALPLFLLSDLCRTWLNQGMDTLRGNAIVAQSGGPTAVINSSACCVIQETLRHRGTVPQIFDHGQFCRVDYLRQFVAREMRLRVRYNKFDTCQRNAVHFASRTESDEAYRCGEEAVQQGLQEPREKWSAWCVPRDYLDVAGAPSAAMCAYAGPLAFVGATDNVWDFACRICFGF